MSAESQWPRYIVFERPEAGAAFILAGSVHAPDNEMAVLVARDTYARRPRRTAMWVVRDDRIFSMTRQQLQETASEDKGEAASGEASFDVFVKRTERGVHVHLGKVKAADPVSAIRLAQRELGDGNSAVWWVIPSADITGTSESDREVLYGSSPGKPFRHEREYPVRTMMRDLRKKRRS